MTYIIQNRIIQICENEKDYGEYIKELLFPSLHQEPMPSRASVPCWHEHYRGEKEEGDSQHRHPITIIRL